MAGAGDVGCSSLPFCCRTADDRRIGQLPFPLPRTLDSVLDAALRLCRAFYTNDSVLFSLHVMVIHKKFLKLSHKLLAQLLHMMDMRVAVVRFLDGDDTIVPLTLLLLALLALDDADDTAFQDAAGEGRFVHEHKHICRIAIFGFSRGDKAEVIRKGHAGR